jgi:SAM-dependent methyltransferase
LTDRAISACALPADSRVWDVGCGLGVTVAHLIRRYGFDAVGVDSSEDLLGTAHGRMPWLPLVHAQGDALPCATGSLDAVLAECSWSAMAAGAGPETERSRRSRILAEFRRVLRPRGWLIISDLYARGAGQVRMAPVGEGCWQTMPTEPEVRAVVANEGFDIELWEDHSLALREFAARMILEHGSLESLWGGGGHCATDRADLMAARPGYFLLIGRNGGPDV